MRGAIREDDNPAMPLLANDDPVNAFRPLSHFFDPVHNLPLTAGGRVGGAELGSKNPNWALGATDAFGNPNARDNQRQNHFSIHDAREAMWRALTLLDGSMAPLQPVQEVSFGEALRKAYWATTFRAIGNLAHMAQDLAQPQHSRNEPHSGLGGQTAQGRFAGHASVYESYVDERASEVEGYVVTGSGNPSRVAISSLEPIWIDSYPVPTFHRLVDYFSTSVAASPAASYGKPGYGIADYSNRRFFTAAKNFGHPDFQLPVSNPAAYSRCKNPDGTDLISTRWDGSPNPNGAKAAVLCAASVMDELNAEHTATNVPLTAESIWDAGLTQNNAPKTYHMTREVYDAQARLLLPRAVAYTAGIIDYFFRGELWVAPPDEGIYALLDHGDSTSNCKDSCGFTKVKLKLANITRDITPPHASAVRQNASGGTVVAIAKFRRNSCYTTDLSGERSEGEPPGDYYQRCVAGQPEEIVVSNAYAATALDWCDPAAPTGSPDECQSRATALTFTFQSPIPINAANLSLQVAYRGALGAEADGIAVQTVDVTEPSYFTYMNATDYIKLGSEVHTRAEINGSSQLRDLVRPTGCIVDDRLSETCFQPFGIAFPLRWPNPGTGTTSAPLQLGSARQFSRFAMIAPPETSPVKIDDSGTPCYIKNSIQFPGRKLQEEVTESSVTRVVGPIGIARGVYATHLALCVVNGDGQQTTSSLGEAAVASMAALASGERVAQPSPGFTFGN